MNIEELRAQEYERAKREDREADGLVFQTTERRNDYLRRKANAEKSGRYANLPK